MPQQPLAVTKIAFDEGLYELSWKSPLLSNQIINYTIFWCENERDRPYQCTVSKKMNLFFLNSRYLRLQFYISLLYGKNKMTLDIIPDYTR